MEILGLVVVIVILFFVGYEIRKMKPVRKQKEVRKLPKEQVIRLIKREEKPTVYTTRSSTRIDELESHYYNLKSTYDSQVAYSLSGNRLVQVNGKKVIISPAVRERCLFSSRRLRNDTLRDYGIDLARLELAKNK